MKTTIEQMHERMESFIDEPEKPIQDLVNHPAHYNEYGLENLEAIEGSMSPIEYQGFLKASALKYIYRFRLKGNPVMDLDKAINYLTMLKDRMEEME